MIWGELKIKYNEYRIKILELIQLKSSINIERL